MMRLERGFVLFAATFDGKEDRAAMVDEAKAYCARDGYDQSSVSIAGTGTQILVRTK